MLNGGQKVAIMLLLDGSGRVDSLVHLQMRWELAYTGIIASAEAPVPDLMAQHLDARHGPCAHHPRLVYSGASHSLGRFTTSVYSQRSPPKPCAGNGRGSGPRSALCAWTGAFARTCEYPDGRLEWIGELGAAYVQYGREEEALRLARRRRGQ
jgi:hypothetical protein